MITELEQCVECHKWFNNKTLHTSKIKFDYTNPEDNSIYIFKVCPKCWVLTSDYFVAKSLYKKKEID